MIALLACLTLAGPVEDGAAPWSAGDIQGALTIWEGALREGRGSATLHRNIAVARYRSGDLPRAVAHLRMARILSPRDADAAHDLAVIRAELGTPNPRDPLPAWLGVGTVGELGALGLVLLLASSAGAWLARTGALLRRPGPVWPWLLLAFPGFLASYGALEGARMLAREPVAVVLASEARLRPDPDPAAPLGARLPAGAEVEVVGESQGFVRVLADDDVGGWVPESAIARIGINFSASPP